MTSLPSHPAHPTSHRRPPCPICQTAESGATERVCVVDGVRAHRRPEHPSPDRRTAHGGRDLELAGAGPQRVRPGSCAWPTARAAVEAACADGTVAIGQLRRVVEELLSVELRRGRVKAPSERTLRRWRAERRWEAETPASAPGGALAAAP